MKNKVVYTCLVGNYDVLEDPSYVMEDYDYICFSNNNDGSHNNIWKLKPIPAYLSNNRRLSRYPKILPHKILNQYTTSIYIDSNINILTKKLEDRVTELEKNYVNLAISDHPKRDCVYEEALVCIERGLEKSELIKKQISKFKKENFPQNFGLYENNIIYRRHNNPEIIKLGEEWWKLYSEYSQRDQLSLPYLIWKYSIDIYPLFNKGFDVRESIDFKYKFHNKSFKKRLIREYTKLVNKIT